MTVAFQIPNVADMANSHDIQRSPRSWLGAAGMVVWYLGFVGAGWYGYQTYNDIVAVHSASGGADWNGVFIDFGVMMGSLIGSCVGGSLSMWADRR